MTSISSVHKAELNLTNAQYFAVAKGLIATFEDWTYPSGHVNASSYYTGSAWKVVISSENPLDLMEFVANLFMLLPYREEVEVEKTVVLAPVVPLDETLETNRASNTAVDQDELEVPATEDYDSVLVESEVDDEDNEEETVKGLIGPDGGLVRKRVLLKRPASSEKVAQGVFVEEDDEEE